MKAITWAKTFLEKLVDSDGPQLTSGELTEAQAIIKALKRADARTRLDPTARKKRKKVAAKRGRTAKRYARR